MHPLNRRVVAAPVLALLVAAPLPGRAGEFAQAPPAPGMALALPDPGMANGAPAPTAAPPPAPAAEVPAPVKAVSVPAVERRFRALGSGFSSIDGQLPNQRTGQRHQHVVRDICIGC
ncbi:hypothetical protein LOK46_10005 [Methylobacterium sp. NMS14P]|uniref:hypothetical protein n=1 Tax=unclassified Methylobacterium TaxID=2615210 RepID=UPI00235A18A8|nr:hypothetical protein [Methylobacterium sp. NMS14P]WCS27122.1 hypothetical protein LOK46_10005 [Methylobacterium sp. NMS14P]